MAWGLLIPHRWQIECLPDMGVTEEMKYTGWTKTSSKGVADNHLNLPGKHGV